MKETREPKRKSKFMECASCKNMIGCEIYKEDKPEYCIAYVEEKKGEKSNGCNY